MYILLLLIACMCRMELDTLDFDAPLDINSLFPVGMEEEYQDIFSGSTGMETGTLSPLTAALPPPSALMGLYFLRFSASPSLHWAPHPHYSFPPLPHPCPFHEPCSFPLGAQKMSPLSSNPTRDRHASMEVALLKIHMMTK